MSWWIYISFASRRLQFFFARAFLLIHGCFWLARLLSSFSLNFCTAQTITGINNNNALKSRDISNTLFQTWFKRDGLLAEFFFIVAVAAAAVGLDPVCGTLVGHNRFVCGTVKARRLRR